MNFQEPFHVYTPATNVEAHVIVDLLSGNGIPAMAMEEQSGLTLWAFGTIGQFHRPKIWVDKPTAERAYAMILEYEERNRERRHPDPCSGELSVVCEECGKATSFAASLNGTVQVCSHCGAFVDVGELDWDDQDFGKPDEVAQ